MKSGIAVEKLWEKRKAVNGEGKSGRRFGAVQDRDVSTTGIA
jgi:hypothetical protein